MSQRFLLTVSSGPAAAEDRLSVAARLPDWHQVAIADGVMLHAPPQARLLVWRLGVVIGPVFERGADRPLRDLSPDVQSSISTSAGQSLIDHDWGGYVAILATAPNAVAIVRAPFGDLPCYWVRRDGGFAAASDLDLLSLVNRRPSVEAEALARYLAQPDHLSGETCLRDVREVRGGERLCLASGSVPATDALWSPWTFVQHAPPAIATREEAVSRLRDSVNLSVAARTAGHDRSLLLLSGGIDSSIVAASLARAGRDFACLTLVSGDRIGDERAYAAMVARACRVPLIVGHRDIAGIDLHHSASAEQARPASRAFLQESSRLARDAARESGATILIDGGAGDSVFYGYLAVAPLVDLWRREGLSSTAREHFAAMASLSGTSRLRLAARTLLRSLRPAAASRPDELTFLSPAARAAAADRVQHPWMATPPDAWPGEASYVAGLPPVQGYMESADPRGQLPSLSPLGSQPIIETCLKVPTWLWFEQWNSRALVRRAFADRLPPEVIARRSKGTPAGFMGEVFEARRAEIREMLMGGALADAGLLDRAALALHLAAEAPLRDFSFVRIMALVDAEAWMRSWA
ncbi:lasso peptide isopeptide bond-forming cyclase [Sphingomonas oligophenolica]|uniref:asparagine synthase (glutamine-hydrolyzing) n=1 Tax=Sphingomonas oligophenolica TaxID=301154 RepID=A0ABU9Y3I6_9SPHN